MKKFEFYFCDHLEDIQPNEYVFELGDLSDVISETERFAKFKGILEPTFVGQFLEALYRLHRFVPINGVNYSSVIGVACDRNDLHKFLWKIIRKSNMLDLFIERKVITMLEEIEVVKSKHGEDFVVRCLVEEKEARILFKYGVQVKAPEVKKEEVKKVELPEEEEFEVADEPVKELKKPVAQEQKRNIFKKKK